MSDVRDGLSGNGRIGLLLGVAIFTLIHLEVFVSFALAQQQPCETAVAEAQKLYDIGRFTPAISLLRLCLPRGVTEVQRVGAYRLLALAYLAEDQREEAKEAIKEIFGLKRDYACDPAQDPQSYCDLVTEVQANIPVSTWEKLTGGWKKWLWYGGVIGVGTAVYLANQNKTEPENPLPQPPVLPEKP